MTEYDIKMSLGHVLIDNGEGWVLVDTGSPLSFHESGRLLLCGEYTNVPTSLMGVDADYISEKTGERVRGLVGMDFIGRYGVKIDIPGGKLSFGCPTDGLMRVPSDIGLMGGYVTIKMHLNGRLATVILDTGAPISYVAPSFTQGLPIEDTVTDFNPFVAGETFVTHLFKFPASFAGQEFTMRAGHLPSTMQVMLMMLGADGVVGLEILSRFPIVIANGSVWV